MTFVSILSIGNELLIGQTINTNAAWLGKQLEEHGLQVNQCVTVGDTPEAILSALNYLQSISDVIITTGGLGPTNDDISKKVIADWCGEVLVHNDDLWSLLAQKFKDDSARLERNKSAALVPTKAMVLANHIGTASGLVVHKEQTSIILLPGVPIEMKSIMSEGGGIQYLKDKYVGSQRHQMHWLVASIGESKLSVLLTDFEKSLPKNALLAYLPSSGYIKLRITFQLENEADLKITKLHIAKKLEAIIWPYMVAIGDSSLEAYLGTQLVNKKMNMATAESCTGGRIAHLITSVAGSSAYFNGSVVAYQNSVKTEVLKVPQQILEEYGAVSKQAVEYMLKGVLDLQAADCGIAISGIAGPSGATSNKPVGTVWIAVGNHKDMYVECYTISTDRTVNITTSSNLALVQLNWWLQDA